MPVDSSHARNQDRRGNRAGSPCQQNPTVDSAHEFRTEEVSRERRHHAEAAAVAQADDSARMSKNAAGLCARTREKKTTTCIAYSRK